MTSSIVFHVHGLPAPQGSKRHVGRGVMVESSKKVKPWREAVKWAALQAIQDASQGVWDPLAGPCYVYIYFEFARPASHYGTGRNTAILKATAPRYPTASQGDIDKLVRATFDAFTDAGIWLDDKQAVELNCVKGWSRKGTPGASVRIVDLDRLRADLRRSIPETVATVGDRL